MSIFRQQSQFVTAVFSCRKEEKTMANEMFSSLPDVMTAEQLASALQISKSGAYALLNRSDFPTLRIGGRKMVMKKDLLEWLNSRTNRPK